MFYKYKVRALQVHILHNQSFAQSTFYKSMFQKLVFYTVYVLQIHVLQVCNSLNYVLKAELGNTKQSNIIVQ